MKRIIPYIIFFMVGFLVACACSYYFQRTPDEKIKGVWEYKYNDNPQQTLYLRSSKNGMDVGTIGDKVTVFPLKKGANPDGFYFVLEEDKGNYEYYVEKKIRNILRFSLKIIVNLLYKNDYLALKI